MEWAKKQRRISRRVNLQAGVTVLKVPRWLGVEPLERRVLLSASMPQPQIELFNASPALFVENRGQWDEQIDYLFQGSGANIAFTDDGPMFQVFKRAPAEGAADTPDDPFDLRDPLGDEADYITQLTQFSVSFDGANTVSPVGLEKSDSTFNYFIGDQVDWRSDVSGYGVVAYEGLYDGIDLHMWGQRDSLKYEFHVAPEASGGDYTQIEVSYEGIEGLYLDDTGAMHVVTELGELVDDVPYIYQVIEGVEVEVAGVFSLVDADTYQFNITGVYDPTIELVIDPDLAWSTYVGGNNSEDGTALANDNSGNVYVAGQTTSSGWVSGAYDTTYNDGYGDAFVVKISSSGEHLWSTYLGGNAYEDSTVVATDTVGNVYVGGYTGSAGWIAGGYDTSFNGDIDTYVVKLSGDGAHLWSTYVGGTDGDFGHAIATDTVGNVYVGGDTESTNWIAGGHDTVYNGGSYDAFLVKISGTGINLWSTYLGGSDWDQGEAVATDTAGNVYVAGSTLSAGWVSGGFDSTQNGSWDAYLVKLSSSGLHLWSTFLGATSSDYGHALATDTANNVHVAGFTRSSGWIIGGYDTTYGGGGDAFVYKLDSLGVPLWSTYLGGAEDDSGLALATDTAGNVVVGGRTGSAGWVSDGYDTTYNGSLYDGYVAKLGASGGTHLWSTYLGGASYDYIFGLSTDSSDNVYAVGTTESSGWTSSGYDNSLGGFEDAFVVKLEAGLTIEGDLNGDGFVGIDDLNIVLGVWNQNVAPGDLLAGDPSGDGFVGIEDLNTVLGNWNAGTPPIATAIATSTSAATESPSTQVTAENTPVEVDLRSRGMKHKHDRHFGNEPNASNRAAMAAWYRTEHTSSSNGSGYVSRSLKQNEYSGRLGLWEEPMPLGRDTVPANT